MLYFVGQSPGTNEKLKIFEVIHTQYQVKQNKVHNKINSTNSNFYVSVKAEHYPCRDSWKKMG